MREPPALIAPESLAAAVRAAYGLETKLSFLPLGHDSSSWVYKAQPAAGPPRFLKLRAGPLNEPALRVPRLLHSLGVPGIVAPIPTLAGALWAAAGPYALTLYPFVAAESGMAAGLTHRQWIAYGEALRQIHAAPVPPELAALMRRESFVPPGADVVRRADAALRAASAEPSARALAALWRERRAEIMHLLARAEALGRELAHRRPPLVLCHADIHTGNVLRDGDERIWIVDWDETVLAPKERDLMFVVGGISRQLVGPREQALCLQGYGPAQLDQGALAYYRYAWAVSDTAAYAADVLFRPDLGPVAREEALAGLARLFAPGEIVNIARAAE
ncbi:MAG TPA: aminoglycoside phosphotransferase family protein [Chloroflexaceae bacterium]|nr:aminoglycoside phosphotransferase family protein [Chloroflexaceae bacterium]